MQGVGRGPSRHPVVSSFSRAVQAVVFKPRQTNVIHGMNFSTSSSLKLVTVVTVVSSMRQIPAKKHIRRLVGWLYWCDID